ncbi:Divergent AAA domain [uncultured Eubacterium sp.]|nr:Divergent AAA domain [uncultured Eubacterium sp.]
MINLEDLSIYREGNRLEVKKASKGLPKSLWETYSSFANTLGGVILLGITEQEDGHFQITG